jgi:hypothetical protein
LFGIYSILVGLRTAGPCDDWQPEAFAGHGKPEKAKETQTTPLKGRSQDAHWVANPAKHHSSLAELSPFTAAAPMPPKKTRNVPWVAPLGSLDGGLPPMST